MYAVCLDTCTYIHFGNSHNSSRALPIIPSVPSRDKQTDEWKKNKRAIELNNGRAAQMGIAGIMVHELMGNLGDILPATP
jgi:hypothetical protein